MESDSDNEMTELISDLVVKDVDICSAIEPLTVKVPAITQTTQIDATVFYRIPKGFALWDAAVAMSTALAESKGDLNKVFPESDFTFPVVSKGDAILELGSGAVPLPSLVLSSLGAKVVASDFVEEIVSLANINFEANERMQESEAVCELLDWCEPEKSSALNDGQKYDYIIGSDIISVHSLYEDLANTLAVASSKGTIILLCYKERYPGKEAQLFDLHLPKMGFEMVGEVEDDVTERHQKYGKFGHDSGEQSTLKFIALRCL